MATALDPDDLLRSKAGKANFQRVVRLLITGGTTLLRDIFDMLCRPIDLPKLLKNSATVNQLKAAKLTKPQWDCLYPSPGMYGKSADFDITLLFRLLRTVCSLTPPATGWDVLPASSDHSLEADLARIKYYRNSVYGHVNEDMAIMDDAEFLSLWKEISGALVRIAGHISREKKNEWQKAIDNFLKDPLTAEDERNVEELLSWYRNDVEVKKSIEELKVTTQVVQDSLKGTSRVAQEIKDQLGELHQCMDRKLSALAEGSQAAGARLPLRIDCSGMIPESQAGSSEAVASSQDEATAAVGGGSSPSTQEVLNLAAFKYLNTIDPSKPEDMNGFVQYLKEVRRVLILETKPGSLIITVECSSLEILDELWNDYCTGYLTKMAQKYLVTEEILKELGLIEVKLTIIIQEEEYRDCREYLLQVPDFKAKVERTRREGDQDSIEQFPASKGMLVTGVSDAEENVEGQSHFARNKLLVRGLSQLTTRDGLVYFIEAMSGGEEVKEVLMLKNGSALVTMAVDIKNFRQMKFKGEKRGLDKAKVSIEQVPVCKTILVTGFSENTTHDAIELYFESPRNSGGPVEKVHYVPERGRAVVVFQDTRDMERVLSRHEEKPHVLNQTQLSIKVYREFLDGEEGDEAEDTGDLGATVDEIGQAQASQQPEAKTQQLHMAVDPDVMEYVTTTAFEAQLNNSLTVKKSEITWKPNNKTAVIVYRGGDKSDSWQSECIDEVQNFLGKFAKCDVQVNKDFWEAVVAQVPSIRACLGVDPPLIKTIGDSHVARIVSLDIDVKSHEEKVKSKLEEIYREKTRKTYLKKKIPNVSEERLILLKKIKFAEKLQDKNKELEIKLDTEGEEIYFEGPQPQFTEATMKFYKQMADMVEKKLTLSVSILEVLSSDEGLQTVKRELESNNVEAVFVIDRDARILGTSAAHADNAARLVNKLMLEEKVQVDEKSNHLLRSDEWTELCNEMNTQTAVRVHRNNWNDTYVAGFRDDVTEVMKKLNTFLENNCIREEIFVCTSDIVRRYLVEVRQEDLRSIEDQLKDFAVKVKKGKGDDDFDISGNKEGLKRVRRKIDALVDATESKMFDVKQPGLRKYFDSGKGDRLVKSVEKDQDCVIEVQKHLGQKDDELRIESATEDSASSSDADDADDDDEPAASGSDVNTLATTHSHKISWRPGNIEVEKQKQPTQDVEDEDSDSEDMATTQPRRLGHRHAQNQSHEHFVRIFVVGKDKLSVGKAVESLKKGFSEACTTEKIESDVISELSHKQIDILRRKAEDRDVNIVVEADVDRISVRGEPSEVSGMVGEIWKEISERTKKKQEEEQAQLVSKNIEWSYEIHGNKMAFGPKTNAKIEMAHSKEDHTVQVSLRGDQFVIDLKTKTGREQQSGEQITLTRKVKGAEEGIALPKHWAPMPRPDSTVHRVQLLPGSTEYQDVVRKFQATASGVNIQKIERVQNPRLYQSYMARKQKMDNDTGGNSERQLFHGTEAKNVSHINTKGFNRSFYGTNVTNLGRGVYFAREARYSYAGSGSDVRYMYLVRVLVGQYCVGKLDLIVPPPRDPSRLEILYDSVVDDIVNPSIFVIFYDNQCYPEYLITFK